MHLPYSSIQFVELDVKQDSFYSTWTNFIGATNIMWNSFCIVNLNRVFQYWYMFRLSQLFWLSIPNPRIRWLLWTVNHFTTAAVVPAITSVATLTGFPNAAAFNGTEQTQVSFMLRCIAPYRGCLECRCMHACVAHQPLKHLQAPHWPATSSSHRWSIHTASLHDWIALDLTSTQSQRLPDVTSITLMGCTCQINVICIWWMLWIWSWCICSSPTRLRPTSC